VAHRPPRKGGLYAGVRVFGLGRLLGFLGRILFRNDILARHLIDGLQGKTHFAAIVESSDDAILSKNLDGIVQTWNKGAERIFGYSAEEVVGQSVLKLIPEDRHHEEAGIIARIRNGEPLSSACTMP